MTARRTLGRSNLQVSPLCFGGNVFGWTVDEATSFELLDAFVDAGFNFVDTADVYSRWVPGHDGGESETIIGRWFERSGRRADVVLATKVGMDMGGDRKGLKADYIIREVEESLRRLKTDYIDLYQSHIDDPDTPMEETLGAYQRLVRDGKVRVIGASNFSAERLKQSLETSRAHGYPRYESLQPLYNLYDRGEFEGELQDLCVREQIGVINFYALAAGFLTGKYRSAADVNKSQRGMKTVAKYLNERGLAILAALDEVAAEVGAAPGQVAVAWLINQPAVTAPIASATNMEQLRDLIAAVRLRLDAGQIERLNRASAPAPKAR